MGRLHTFVVTLRRESRDSNWGLRLVGGADLATPLIVTRVNPGSPAGRELIRGDIIAKIDDYDARDLRHEDAQNLFRNANQQIRIVVQRSPSPLPSPGGYRGPESLPRRTPMPAPVYSPYPHEEHRSLMLSPAASARTDDTFDESIHTQPYRTTPLVLPGAKVRHEPGPTESYLRHHPNPAMRAAPHHDYRDTVMKQKVAESVIQRVVGDEAYKVGQKQFNSPTNLYSDQSYANSFRQQTSPLPSNGYGSYNSRHVVKSHKPTLLYDPAKSETYKALQEEGLGDIVQEVPIPVQTKVFTAAPHKRPTPTPKPTKQFEEQTVTKQTTFVNSLHEEEIQQSNSFKRLMYNVLSDTDF